MLKNVGRLPFDEPDLMEPRPRGVQDAERQRARSVFDDLPFDDFEVRDPEGEPTAAWPIRNRILARLQRDVILPEWAWWFLIIACVIGIYGNVFQAVR